VQQDTDFLALLLMRLRCISCSKLILISTLSMSLTMSLAQDRIVHHVMEVENERVHSSGYLIGKLRQLSPDYVSLVLASNCTSTSGTWVVISQLQSALLPVPAADAQRVLAIVILVHNTRNAGLGVTNCAH
jgi:hypothetical protein